jgi:hypothetical protein
MVAFNELIEAAKEGGGFEALPQDEYQVEVTGCKYKKASTGKDMWNVEFTVVAGPYAKRKVWNNMVLTPDNPNGLAAFFRQMKLLGADEAFFAANPTEDQVSAKVIGGRCTAPVTQREWNGRITNDMGFLKEGAAGAMPVQDPPSVMSQPVVQTAPTAPTTPPAPPF